MIKANLMFQEIINFLELNADIVIIGGGLAGVCTAVTAARENLKVIFVQDRPVLGGNASSEVRLYTLLSW